MREQYALAKGKLQLTIAERGIDIDLKTGKTHSAKAGLDSVSATNRVRERTEDTNHGLREVSSGRATIDS